MKKGDEGIGKWFGEKTRQEIFYIPFFQILQYYSLGNASRKKIPPSHPAAETINLMNLYSH